MSDTLTDLMFLNKEKTIIQAKQNDTFITIEKDYDVYDLFERVIAGEYGAIDETYIDNLEEEIEEEESIVISRLQAKAILYQNGLLESVEALVADSDFLVQLAWKEAQEFRRSSPLIQAMKEDLQWPDGMPVTDEELDDLFKEASQIEF